MMLSDFKKAFKLWGKHLDCRVIKVRWFEHTDGGHGIWLIVGKYGDKEERYYCSFPENTVLVIKERPC
jgi:hypothetical protein